MSPTSPGNYQRSPAATGVEALCEQTRVAVEHGCWQPALFATLALPDICGALEAPDGQAKPSRYKAWFDRELGYLYGQILSGAQCYLLRNAMLHQGRGNHESQRAVKVIFAANTDLHRMVVEDRLVLSIERFALDVATAVLDWVPGRAGTEPFESNYSRYLHWHPNGLAPFVLGVPVLSS